MTESLVFTENAAKKAWELIVEDDNPALKLRVYVTGGGCSGFQYGFTFDDVTQPDDTIIARTIEVDLLGQGILQTQEVQLLVDPMSFQYLAGAEIDYIEDLEGERFVIRNPNAKTTCGCGSSFSA